MTLNAYQTVPVTCPACQSRFVTPVLPIIDVGQAPQTKALFLSGQINLAVCPQCGHTGMLSTPLVYHDPAKNLLLTYVPPELSATEWDQQRIIGDLTNRVISSLEVEQRRGYLLQPRSFLRPEGMIEAILEADGLTPEMLEAQRAQARLLDRLLATESFEARRGIALENDTQIDYGFFQFLSVNAEIAEAAGRTNVAQQLHELEKQLRTWTTQGKELAAREEALQSLGPEVTRESLLQKLVEAALAGEQVKVETMVALARPAIDYPFYQQLTAEIDAAESQGKKEKAQKLTSLRQTVLELTARIDAEVQQAADEAARFLQLVLDSKDPEGELRSSPFRVDELFLSLLATSLQAAQRAGNSDLAERLDHIQHLAMQLIQQDQPWEIQLINELLSSDFPDGTRAVLEGNRDQLNERLLKIMAMARDSLLRRGQENLANKLGQIEQQIAVVAAERP